MENVITITKTAQKKVEANYARISVTAVGENKEYSVAATTAENAAVRLTAMLSQLDGVEVTSGGISVSTVQSDKKTVGYRAVRKLFVCFEYSHELCDKVVYVLSELPVEFNVAFTYKGEKDRGLLQLAVVGAREDALSIAAAAGVKLGKLCKTEYASDGGHPVVMRAAYGMTPEPEQITLSETVTCSWEIL